MEIPTWEQISVDRELRNLKLNPLEQFIFDNEPEDLGEGYTKTGDFRKGLQELVDWLLEQDQDEGYLYECACPECPNYGSK